MKREHVRFPGASGGLLAARLESPEGEPSAFALFAHCFTCSKDIKAAGWISQALVEQGIAVLRFDFTGIGESEGDFAQSSFSSNCDDLVAAAGFLAGSYRAPLLLIGHSLGGAAVLAAAAAIPSARAVVTIGAPSSTEHLSQSLLSRAPQLAAEGEAEVTLGGSRFRVRRQLLDDLSADHLGAALPALRRALLILHSPVDQIVGIENARRLYDAARHPKSFVSLDRADHLLRDERDARYAGSVIAAWSSRYLESRPRPALEPAPEPLSEPLAPEPASTRAANSPPAEGGAEEVSPEGEVIVAGGAERLAQTIVAGRHRLLVDEPESVPGGGGSGPTPYDLLLAALGACTSMTLALYARQKGLPFAGARVRLRHSRIHAADCLECQIKEGKLSRIEREIEILGGPFTDEQRARLLEIANRCPVHRTLTSEIDIPTRLV